MAVSELPGNPNAVWTVKKRIDGELSLAFVWLYVIRKKNLLDYKFFMESENL